MNKKSIDQFKVRTGLRAGTSCDDADTNCKGIAKDGRIVWNNCDHEQPFAGATCWQAIEENGGGTCNRC